MKTVTDEQMMLTKARYIAKCAHQDHLDPDGMRTIDRIEDIVNDIDDPLMKTVAYLHRGVVTRQISIYELKMAGFSHTVQSVLACLNRYSFETDADYIERVFQNDRASYVLLTYFAHDLSTRIAGETEPEKVQRARMRIMANRLADMWLELR